MKLRRFTDAGVAKTRAFLAAVKESNYVENVTLNGQPFTRATLLSSPDYSLTPSLPHSLTDFGIIFIVRNGKGTHLTS